MAEEGSSGAAAAPAPAELARHPSEDAPLTPPATVAVPAEAEGGAGAARPVRVEDLAPHCCGVHGVEVRADRPCAFYEGLLSAAECAAIEEALGGRHAATAESLAPGARSQFSVEDTELAGRVWGRIKPYLPQEMDGGRAIGLRSRWNHARYLPGQSVFGHMDQRQASAEHAANPNVASRMSLTIYLDDGYEGGEFVFIRGLRMDGSWEETHKTLRPKRGDAVLFYQAVPEFQHAVPPLKAGVKSIMRSDVLYEFPSAEEADVGGTRGVEGGRPVARD